MLILATDLRHLSASVVVIYYAVAIYQVYAPLPLLFTGEKYTECSSLADRRLERCKSLFRQKGNVQVSWSSVDYQLPGKQ